MSRVHAVSSVPSTTTRGVLLATAPVTCHFTDGERRLLVARGVTLAGAWVVSMRVPAVGTRLTVVFDPKGQKATLPIQALVTMARLDPARAEQCGFEIVFTHLDDGTLEALADVLADTNADRDSVPTDPGVERRTAPRIECDEPVVVELAGQRHVLVLRNLSMSGALITAGGRRLPTVWPGDACVVAFERRQADPQVRIPSMVARVVQHEGEPAIAIRFLEVDGTTASVLETRMLESISLRR